MGRPRKICVVLVDRANYGRLKPVMREIDAHPALTLQTVAAGTMVLDRFDRPVNEVRENGFHIDGITHVELEGSMPVTMAKSLGFAVIEFSGEFARLRPDVVLLIGDRYEALAAALAAGYMNLCIAHIQGGEVSGSIDECARHAISRFAHFHFPSTHRAEAYLERMGERPDTILSVGCPSSDIARKLDRSVDMSLLDHSGSGAAIDPSKPFILTMFHPTTTEYGNESQQMEQLLLALESIALPTVLFWPNIDAGSDHISKCIRIFRDRHAARWFRTVINLPPEEYLKLLSLAACAVGNSSSFVRDAGYIGTPVVLVGNRQRGRGHDGHVDPVTADADAISSAVERQLAPGRYAQSSLYGDGFVAGRIADALARLEPYHQKRLHYVEETRPFPEGRTENGCHQ
ncbi:MAG: UDP-N-acetylglucosamine 2-epimerase (hydrolyzing) [Sulfitobacter sp.]|nr:UDP-N-acetylglucosamine 2-epimerase (hydrolyzing) [Sulfitobacter sp.]